MSKKPCIHNFNVMLSGDDAEQLQKVADQLDTTKSVVARTAIRALCAHHLTGAPTCSTGQPCYVPHMHPRTSKAAE